MKMNQNHRMNQIHSNKHSFNESNSKESEVIFYEIDSYVKCSFNKQMQ